MALSDSPSAPASVRAAGEAKPLRWLLGAVGMIALLAGGGWWSQRSLARIPLPNGEDLLLVEAHYAPTLRLAQRLGPWQRLKHFLPGFEGDPSDSFDAFDGGMPGGPKTLWLVFRGANSKNSPPDFPLIGEVAVLDSQITIGASIAQTIDDLQGVRYIVGFGVFPRRTRQLHLRIQAADQTIEATIPNPIPVTNAPSWTPEPVPQSRKLQSGELVLQGLHLNSAVNPMQDIGLAIGSIIEPDFEIRNGDIPRTAFNLVSEFADATGNRSNDRLPLSEPVWKIQTTVQRNETYPFPISEGTSLGHVTMPAAGEFRLLRLPIDSTAIANRYVLLAGPGKYRVTLKNKPEVKVLDPSIPISDSEVGVFQCDQPVCRFFTESSFGAWDYVSGPLRIVRAISPTGEVVVQKRVRMENIRSSQKEREFPGTPPPPGTDLDIQFIVSNVESVNFFVRPPR